MSKKGSNSQKPPRHIPEARQLVEISGIKGRFPKGLVEAWGEKSLQEVLDCIEDPIHDEMNEVVFESDLSPAEQTIYLEASPEVHAVRAKLLQLEDQVMKELLPKLEKRLKHLISHWGQPDSRAYLEDFMILYDYPNLLRQFITKGSSIRNMRVMELMTGMINRMIFHTHIKMAEWRVPTSVRDSITGMLKGLFDHLSKVNGLNYMAFNMLNFCNKNRVALVKTEQKNRGKFEALLNSAPKLTAEELELLILEVEDLLSSRRQSFTTVSTESPLVFCPVIESEPISRACEAAKAALILDPFQHYRAPQQAKDGTTYAANEGALEVIVDRSIHEVCIPQTHFPMKLLFEAMNTPKAGELYQKLKILVYTKLRDFLQKLPQDPQPKNVETPKVVRQEVNEEVGVVMEAPKYVPYIKLTPATAVPVLENEPIGSPARLRFDECTGFSGNAVSRMLKDLIGEPERIRGSHHLFRGPNGTLLPVPLHGSDSVNPRILRDCLEAWGLTQAWRQILQR